MQTIINANESLSSKCIQYEYEFDYNVTTNPLTIDIIIDNEEGLNDVDLCKQCALDYDQVNSIKLI
jgi:cell fate regulator YaaT (PSP1 superfamily)